MGDSTDASSNAARSAQAETDETNEGAPGAHEKTGEHKTGEQKTGEDEQSGFFRRLFDAFTPQDDDEDADGSKARASGVLGLGNLRTLTVEDVAIPTSDIVSVSVEISKDDLVKVFRESGLSRVPVYDGTLDSPIGMAHLKDFALMHGFNGGGAKFSLRKMLRPLLYVPPSMPIGVLLQNMQSERRHMALVIDEYGGVDGLVTIEDLIEQVVGEIEDEHDTDEDTFWVKEPSGSYVALAKTPLSEFEDELGLSLTEAEEVDEEEIDTLGGLVFMLLGRVPVRGEIVEHPGGTTFEVIEADPRRIKRLRVRAPGQAES